MLSTEPSPTSSIEESAIGAVGLGRVLLGPLQADRRCPASFVVYEPDLVDPERVALAGFLGGYRGLTRDAYALDLRQFVAFCNQRHLGLFEVRRSDIETFGRELEARGRATATIARRLCTVTGFYRYAEEEGLIAHSPAVHVRRPRIDYESHAIGLDRNEVGALLVAAGLGPAAERALISLLALNGLRVSEAIGADIEALGLERGHRTLTVLRKGGTSPSRSRRVLPALSTWPSVSDPHHSYRRIGAGPKEWGRV
jgi:integrase